MNTATSSYASAADTREKILDAAEALFVEKGYSATSLRAIATSAEVNLAATNYHFGSKEGLFQAVLHRRIAPVNAMRLSLLKELIDSEHPLTTRDILNAFFAPFKDGSIETIPTIMGRLFAEPQAFVQQIIEQEFSELSEKFLGALSTVLPEVEPEELRWRFHFMIGSMLQMLRIPAPIGTEHTPEKFTEGIVHLLSFTVAGMEQAKGVTSHD